MDRLEYPPGGDGDTLIEEVSRVLYEGPYVAVPQCAFVGEDIPYRRFIILQQQTKQLEENDKRLRNQTQLLQATDKRLEEKPVREKKQRMLEERVKKQEEAIEHRLETKNAGGTF